VKVLQLHNRQLTRGGADIQMEREAEGLRKRGHLVDAVLVDNGQVAEIGRVRAAAKAVWNGQVVGELSARIRSFGPDVVHVHTPFPLMSPAVFVAAHRTGVPVVATSQSHRYNCIKATMLRDGKICEACVGRSVKLPGVRHRCYQDSLPGSAVMTTTMAVHQLGGTFRRCIDRYLALTPFMRERIIAEGIPPSHVVVKPNSAPDPGPPRTEREGYALYAGRFVPEKGIATLLAAWSAFTGPLDLVVVGDGDLRPSVEAAAADDPRITLHGWRDSEGVASLLAGADVLVLPSEWYEGLPVVLAEAFAAGTPVISSDVGNFTDYVEPGVNGTRFSTADPASLRQALDWFVTEADHPGLRAGARATFDEVFEAERVLDQLESVYRSLVS
jgi:glycosyltransferase involved in cell wall biosynthesis